MIPSFSSGSFYHVVRVLLISELQKTPPPPRHVSGHGDIRADEGRGTLQSLQDNPHFFSHRRSCLCCLWRTQLNSLYTHCLTGYLGYCARDYLLIKVSNIRLLLPWDTAGANSLSSRNRVRGWQVRCVPKLCATVILLASL